MVVVVVAVMVAVMVVVSYVREVYVGDVSDEDDDYVEHEYE